MNDPRVDALKDAVFAMTGHLAAIDLTIRILIETHPYPDVFQTSFKQAMTHCMSALLNSDILPDSAINATQEVLEEYEEEIRRTVEIDNEVNKGE